MSALARFQVLLENRVSADLKNTELQKLKLPLHS